MVILASWVQDAHPQVPQGRMLRFFHHRKKNRKVDDPRRIGVAKFDAASVSEWHGRTVIKCDPKGRVGQQPTRARYRGQRRAEVIRCPTPEATGGP